MQKHIIGVCIAGEFLSASECLLHSGKFVKEYLKKHTIGMIRIGNNQTNMYINQVHFK
jgi:hypothetical protein